MTPPLKPLVTVLALLVLTTSCATSARQTSGAIEGIAIHVVDGDTFDLNAESGLQDDAMLTRVRLAGIDAPERSQAFGAAAKNALATLIENKQIQVVVSGRDRYGRIIGKVQLNGQDVCLQMIQQGMAWHF
jgi:micrococcal nuclease